VKASKAQLLMVVLQISFDVAGSLNDMTVQTHRNRHLAYLMADQGALVGNPESVSHLPKQHLSRLKQILRWLLFPLIGCMYPFTANCMPVKQNRQRNQGSVHVHE
jgi:hypothetical protein